MCVGEYASVNSSVALQPNRLLIVGGNTATRDSGVVFELQNGCWKSHCSLPGLGTGGRYTWQSSGQVLSTAAALVHLQDSIYAVISNPKTKKNPLGYTPEEELYTVNIQEYLSKGWFENAMDFLGGLYACIGGRSSSTNASSTYRFWKPVTEMENSGAAIAAIAAAVSTSTNATTDNAGTHIICAVGGYQALSPKFYQVFSAKEKVSRSARILRVEAATADSNRKVTPGWTRLPDMIVRRKNLAIVIVGNYLYALGGQDDQGKTLSSVERLNLAAALTEDPEEVWQPVAPMITARHSFAASTTTNNNSGVIVVAGGCNSAAGRLNTVECFLHTHTDNQEWIPLPNLQTPRMHPSLSIVNNGSKLVVTGGTKTPGPFWGTGNLDTIETLDIVTSVVVQSTPPFSAALPPSTTTNTPPVAHAQVILDEDLHDGFVPVVHAPPTAPAHWHVPQSVATLPSSLPAEPSTAPTSTTIDQSAASSTSSANLPVPIPPPQDKTAIMTSTTHHSSSNSSLEAAGPPLPPPLMPPTAVATARVPNSDEDQSCAVCLERKMQVAFFCGHQACLQCSPQLQECHICRKPIQGRIQLFGD